MTGAPSVLEVSRGALEDHVVSVEHSAEEMCPMRAVQTVTVSQSTWRDAIAGICDLIKNAMTALATVNGHNAIKRTEN